MSPRWVSVVVGGWLFVSAWILPAPPEARGVQCVAGALIFLLAFVAMGVHRARRWNTILGACVVLVPFLLALHSAVTGLNQIASGLVAMGASLLPEPTREPPARRRGPELPPGRAA